MDCPTAEQLETVLTGRAPGETEAAVSAHLETCPDCRQRLDAMAIGTSGLLRRARVHSATSEQPSPHLLRALEALESTRYVESGPAPAPRLDFLAPAERPGVLGLFSTYEVIEHVASGGMGLVLKARDPGLERIVALKILSPTLAASAPARSRFLREARAAAAVVHDHVVPIHAVDEWHGLPFLVMQFIAGRTLAERIREATARTPSQADIKLLANSTAASPIATKRAEGRIPSVSDTCALAFEEILRIGAQTAYGLAAGHAQGLVHRDVKPGNILLENGIERVKLTDFGLARAVDEAHLTTAGELAGTPEYMSPEQAGDGEIDARSDLFSLGCVLYAMATGSSPFHAPTSIRVIRRVCDFDPPPLHKISPALPRAFGELVQKLLAKKPEERIQTAEEVARLLTEWQTQQPQDERPFARGFPLRKLILAGAVLLIVALGWVASFRLGSPRPGSSDSRAWTSATFAVHSPNGQVRARFGSLPQAVAASQSGETIEVHGNGRIPTSSISLTNKALRLRAAPKAAPILVATNQVDPLITTDSPLVIEGLALEFAFDRFPFRMQAGQSPPALNHHQTLIMTRPEQLYAAAELPAALIRAGTNVLLLSHCRLVYRGFHDLRLPAAPPCLLLHGTVACELTDSELVSLNGTGIRHTRRSWSGVVVAEEAAALVLTLSNCIHVGRVFLNTHSTRGQPTKAQLHRSTICAGSVIAINADMPLMKVQATQCIFDAQFLLHEYRPGQPMRIQDRVNWSDGEMLFAIRRGFVGRERLPTVQSLVEWNAMWDQKETGSHEAAIRFPNMLGDTADLMALSATNFVAATAQGIVSGIGAHPESVGPGLAYQRWRQSGEYAKWEKRVSDVLSLAR